MKRRISINTSPNSLSSKENCHDPKMIFCSSYHIWPINKCVMFTCTEFNTSGSCRMLSENFFVLQRRLGLTRLYIFWFSHPIVIDECSGARRAAERIAEYRYLIPVPYPGAHAASKSASSSSIRSLQTQSKSVHLVQAKVYYVELLTWRTLVPITLLWPILIMTNRELNCYSILILIVAIFIVREGEIWNCLLVYHIRLPLFWSRLYIDILHTVIPCLHDCEIELTWPLLPLNCDPQVNNIHVNNAPTFCGW